MTGFTKIEAPTTCPSCNSTLELVNSQLFCKDSLTCPAQSSKKLQHFCKVLKIKGFGEKTLEKLGLTSINELTDLDYATLEDILGAKTASNLIAQVDLRLNNKIPVSEFLAAASIPLVGQSVSKKLAAMPIDDMTYESVRAAGVTDTAASNLLVWVATEWESLAEYWAEYLVVEDTIKEKTERKGAVCITGTLTDFPNRAAATEHLNTLGWDVKSSVTKTVKYLICEDVSKKTSSSYKKAQSYGIDILTIKDLEDK